MGKQARNKDYRYQNIQKAVAYAAKPMVKIMDIPAYKDNPSENDLQDTVDGATNSVTLLAGASGSINQIQRELLKPKVSRTVFKVLSCH